MDRFSTSAMLAVALCLSACGGSPDDSAETPADTSATTPATSNPAQMSIEELAGTYEYANADGDTMTTVINPTGSYTTADVTGEPVAAGTVTTADGKVCFTAEGADEEDATCLTTGDMDQDGKFEVTPAEGEPYEMTKVA